MNYAVRLGEEREDGRIVGMELKRWGVLIRGKRGKSGSGFSGERVCHKSCVFVLASGDAPVLVTSERGLFVLVFDALSRVCAYSTLGYGM